MVLFRQIWLLRKFYYLMNIFSVKNEVCMCNISMEWKICRLHGGIKSIRLHNLQIHNTILSDPWLRTLEHNFFQTCKKLFESKTFSNCYVMYQVILEYNYKYNVVKIERSKLLEFSNFQKNVISIFSKENVTINLNIEIVTRSSETNSHFLKK